MRRALVLALLLTGCFGEAETPFPPGLEPLEEVNLAEAPAPLDGDPTPEALVLTRSFATTTEERTPAVHGRGYVHAPIADVWEALQDPDVGADRRTFSEWSTTYDVEPQYEVSYVIHSVIRNIVTVEYDVTWRHGNVVNEPGEPRVIAARWQKTAGSTVIEDLRGSVVLREVAPDVTEIEIIEFLVAVASNHRNIESFLRDMFAELVIRSRGEELPPIDEL